MCLKLQNKNSTPDDKDNDAGVGCDDYDDDDIVLAVVVKAKTHEGKERTSTIAGFLTSNQKDSSFLLCVKL